MSDACHAIRWVAENGTRHGGNLDHLILAGDSAGANLALSVALALTLDRPETHAKLARSTGIAPVGLLTLFGLFQVSDPERLINGDNAGRKLSFVVQDRLRGVSSSYLKDSPATAVERELADPLLLLEHDPARAMNLPPVFAGVGTADPILSDTVRLNDVLAGIGKTCHAHYYDAEPHGFPALFWRENARKFWRDAREYLEGLT